MTDRPPYRLIGQSLWVRRLFVVPNSATTVPPAVVWGWAWYVNGEEQHVILEDVTTSTI